MDNTVERQEQLKQIKALIMSGQQENIDIAEQTAIAVGLAEEHNSFIQGLEDCFWTLRYEEQVGQPIAKRIRLLYELPLRLKIKTLLLYRGITLDRTNISDFSILKAEILQHLNIDNLYLEMSPLMEMEIDTPSWVCCTKFDCVNIRGMEGRYSGSGSYFRNISTTKAYVDSNGFYEIEPFLRGHKTLKSLIVDCEHIPPSYLLQSTVAVVKTESSIDIKLTNTEKSDLPF